MPHWKIEGGAGFYIFDLLSELRAIANVQVAGPYGGYYDKEPILSKFFNKLTMQSLPTYKGIGLAAIVYHLFLSLVKIASILVTPRRNFLKYPIDVLIFTSSIQAIGVPIARLIFPNCRIVVLVQENICLTRGFGRLTSFLLKRANVIVSITETWAQHARECGLSPTVLHNQYDSEFADPVKNISEAIESDLLYVGGGSKIKGFQNLIAALPMLLNEASLKIILLGSYNPSEVLLIKRVVDNIGSDCQIEVVGLVSDIRPYLRGTKILLLPIGSPHFCRPAIEAGLFGKPFIISDFPELSDFSLNGENCITFKSNNIQSFVESVRDLLDKPSKRKLLGEKGLNISSKYVSNDKLRLISLNVILGLL